MSDPLAIATRYLDTWNEIDPQRRRRRLAEGWTDDARYVDPLMSGSGAAGRSRSRCRGNAWRWRVDLT